MTNKHLVLAGIVAVMVVVLGLGVFSVLKPAQSQQNLGTAQAYQALNNQNLLTELNNINTDATNVRSSLAANTATTSLGFTTLGVLGASTSTTSTSITVAAAKFGDGAFCTDNTTSTFIDLNGTAESGTILCYFANVSTSAQSVVTGTITAYDVPAANFFTVSALSQ